MPADSIRSEDRDLMARLTIAIALGFLFVSAFMHLDRLYSQKFFDVTGKAEWIWARHQISSGVPVAFFAVRDFDLPANRYYTHIKVAGDPEYTLYFNGQEIGGRRFGEDHDALDLFDVTQVAKTGRNRIAVAVRSTNGVGGLIAAIDLSPEVENYVVTDASWRIFNVWNAALPQRDVGRWSAPMILGQPPTGRWNYLATMPGKPQMPVQTVVAPRETFSFFTVMPEVKVIGGVAVVGSKRVRATAFDFGQIADGRARLSIDFDNKQAREISVRFANVKPELYTLEGDIRPFVFAAGERTVIDPEVRHFRYVMVYGGQARAEVLR
jgi:hypothetical protein